MSRVSSVDILAIPATSWSQEVVGSFRILACSHAVRVIATATISFHSYALEHAGTSVTPSGDPSAAMSLALTAVWSPQLGTYAHEPVRHLVAVSNNSVHYQVA